ncbi:hypothetical protein [Candidatus Uabimicrobium sp. HlEnr_7]|uniref:hypothetical protein n=1 Tax=Candidatus Uabimicrobium helgolandensis TaxID=3095367 RepID=UPI003558C799
MKCYKKSISNSHNMLKKKLFFVILLPIVTCFGCAYTENLNMEKTIGIRQGSHLLTSINSRIIKTEMFLTSKEFYCGFSPKYLFEPANDTTIIQTNKTYPTNENLILLPKKTRVELIWLRYIYSFVNSNYYIGASVKVNQKKYDIIINKRNLKVLFGL